LFVAEGSRHDSCRLSLVVVWTRACGDHLRVGRCGRRLDVEAERVLRKAPGHAAEVRRLVFDQLDPDEVGQLRGIALKILATLDA
jgi:hypothetical protein